MTLSAENRAAILALKTGFTAATGAGWWGLHEETLNRLLDAVRAEALASPPPPAEGVGKEEHGSSCTDLSCAQTHTPGPSPAGSEVLTEALERDHDLAQIPALIMSNIEELPGWKDSAVLVTAHCHAYVLHHDLPDALSPATTHPREGDVGKLVEALKEAERFMAYFADETRTFVGPGTPKTCLAAIRTALAAAEAASPVLLEGDLGGSSGADIAVQGTTALDPETPRSAGGEG